MLVLVLYLYIIQLTASQVVDLLKVAGRREAARGGPAAGRAGARCAGRVVVVIHVAVIVIVSGAGRGAHADEEAPIVARDVAVQEHHRNINICFNGEAPLRRWRRVYRVAYKFIYLRCSRVEMDAMVSRACVHTRTALQIIRWACV